MAESALLIVNPRAALDQQPRRWEELQAQLKQNGVAFERAFTESLGHAVDLAQEKAGRYATLVAVGGDGMVGAVASGILLSGAEAVLGVVPFGTGNDVARMAGVRSVSDAMDVLRGGKTMTWDAVEVRCQHNGATATRYALLYGSVGFGAELLRQTTERVKRLFGPKLCYTVGLLRALVSYGSPFMRLTHDGGREEGRMFFVSAGNAEMVGGATMRLSPDAKIDDGLLNVNVMQSLGRLEILRHLPKLFKGTHVSHPKVKYFPATFLTVEASPPTEVQMDGDIFGQTPVEFRVRAGALKVVAKG